MKRVAAAAAILALLPAPAAGADVFPAVAGAASYRVDITDTGFHPDALRGALDRPVRILIRNRGERVHNFVLPAFYIFTNNLKANDETEVEFTPDKRGVYPFFSDAGGAREPGLAGRITVE